MVDYYRMRCGFGMATSNPKFAGFALLFHPTSQIPMRSHYGIKVYCLCDREFTLSRRLNTQNDNRPSQIMYSIVGGSTWFRS